MHDLDLEDYGWTIFLVKENIKVYPIKGIWCATLCNWRKHFLCKKSIEAQVKQQWKRCHHLFIFFFFLFKGLARVVLANNIINTNKIFKRYFLFAWCYFNESKPKKFLTYSWQVLYLLKKGKNRKQWTQPHPLALLYKDSSIFLFALVEKLQELKDYVSILYFSPHFTLNFFEGICKYHPFAVVI